MSNMRAKKHKQNNGTTSTSNDQLPPKATIISLPIELLLDIFKDLDNQTLFNLGVLCRRLNSTALHNLIQRYCPSSDKGYIQLDMGTPSLVYSALHSAVFLPHLVSFSMDLRPAPLGQLRMISEIIKTKASLHRLSISLSPLAVYSKKGQKAHCDTLTTVFQNLIGDAVGKGCTDIRVSGTWGLGYQAGKTKLGRLKTKQAATSRNEKSSRRQDDGIEATTSAGTDHSAQPKLTSITLDSPLLFEKSWRGHGHYPFAAYLL
ncbi:hypothetical protein BDN72DRAFT_466022 [Pluteus cervinus]|uniref:Uncharacterized protein n=1 Tax=Pluteus cervinus TaxID=181527 RepID=A0ACD3A6G0_9AGAR|nr:hypothetical protein BDN72DRAFT_466022 [Pluteus cervinus]